MRKHIKVTTVNGRIREIVEKVQYGQTIRVTREYHTPESCIGKVLICESPRAKQIKALKELFSHLQPSVKRENVVIM